MNPLNFSAWRPHPWHGLDAGPQPPSLVHAYIEITPLDAVKYEVDKASGYLKVDRPQLTSSLPPTLYGFIPRTYCGARVARLAPGSTYGDRDPMDICVLTERPIHRAEIFLVARVVGGLLMVDKDEADDKIIAVLKDDPVWGPVQDIGELPHSLVSRLEHYFNTYKALPGQSSPVHIHHSYGHADAHAVIRAAMEDYAELIARSAAQ
ncbi:MAG TPA: inorganic pyrophosphatase [Burkholderiales bacterium]|jgi:inorganic pyrophosphatase|nr:inorganic pyrophosphatase [Burkholderiales bacterium]